MEEQQPPTVLKRRNSIAAYSLPCYSPINLSLPTSISLNGVAPKIDLELLSLKSSSSYTSLRDILPSSAVNSPTTAAAVSPFSVATGTEISIRNRLVKQAAWAYLQPMSNSSPSSSGPTNFLRRIWLQVSGRNPISACLWFINYRLVPGLSRIVDRVRGMIRIRVST